jgi:hypothetical protein
VVKASGIIVALVLLGGAARAQQIAVNPTGVNVNAHGATTVFLTYGPIRNLVPAEACWAGELIPATPDLGLKPDPSTIFGCLPARYDHSTTSLASAFTDIMSIPPSVALRAYQAAVQGADSRFFYVRRFASTVGGPSQFVAVTCRLTGGGARTPFSLTDVRLQFDVDSPVAFIQPGGAVPKIKADITYTGTGRLKGRWEIVLPGEETPSESDLLTEATLPIEQRGSQKRFTQLSRFDEFLPPTGKYTLKGPDPSQFPNKVEGPYLILLRVEASDDREGDSDQAAVGVGPSIVHSGGVAGFPIPPLRYFIGGNDSRTSTGMLTLLAPAEGDGWPADALEFNWTASTSGALYRLDIADDRGTTILSALLPPGIGIYRAPTWLKERTAGRLSWRVSELEDSGKAVKESGWRVVRLIPGK